MKRLFGLTAASIAATLIFWAAGAPLAQSKAPDEYGISVECGLAIYHAFRAYDELLRESGSSVTEYAPAHSNRVSCTSEGDNFLIVRMWNDEPGVLGGAMNYKLDKADYSILEVIPER